MDQADPHLGILDRLQAGILVHAPDTRIMFANPRACQLLGLAPELAQVVVDFFDIKQCRRAERQHLAHEAFITVVLDSLTEHIAVVDKDANIAAVNRAWHQFASANGGTAELQSAIGINYFCAINVDRDAPKGDQELASFAGIRDVLSGTRSHFSIEYPCQSQTERRLFRMPAAPLGDSQGGVVISHHNITERH